MRVAVLNRKRDTHPGGDLVQIDATIAALGRLGVYAVYAPEGWTPEWLASFDVAHMFHMNFGWSMYNYRQIQEWKIPYVVTPIFYPTCELGATRNEMHAVVNGASAITPNSDREFRELLAVLGWGAFGVSPFVVPIPNGTGRLFHAAPAFAVDDRVREGVICVTPREGDKNTELVAAACSKLDIPFTLVHSITDRAELASIYQRARVFVNASTSERMSLTTGEALCAGCRVVDTIHNRGNSWYGRGLVQVDPVDPERLKAAVELAYRSETWNYQPNAIARSITWDEVAGELLRVYERVLGAGAGRVS